jgi:hypothetical protein
MSPPATPPPRQGWLAAQRIAAGDCVEEAAAFADAAPEAVRAAHATAAFQAQIAAEARKLGMSDAAWAERLRGLMRQATEVALADGRVSTVNLLLRASLVLPAFAAGGPAARAAAEALALPAATAHAAPPEPANDDEPAAPPPVEADPAREARRLDLLARVKRPLRPGLARTPLALLEQLTAAADPDPTAYEAWFAAQPKPAPEPVPRSPEDLAAIRRVTRHNPPWLRGEYLGYHRPPVPKEAFGDDERCTPATGAVPVEASAPPAPAKPSAPADDTLESLRARVLRLLDPALPRLPEELDLAEAICAQEWPKWPAYRGPVDPNLLRRALRGVAIDPDTLHRLGSPELAEACRAGPDAPFMAQGP